MKKALKITGIVVGVLLVCVVTVVGWGWYKIRHMKDSHDLQAQVDSACSRYLRKDGGVGLFVGIIQGDTIFARGYGVMDKDSQLPVDSNTIFEIGSATKVFTTALTQMQANAGILSWGDHVYACLPEQARPGADDSTTLRHLASHTSGYPRLPEEWFPKLEQNECDPYSTLTIDDLWSYTKRQKAKKKPGNDTYEYSNLGMGLLGHILELKTGKVYEDLLQQGICSPLGMMHTGTVVNDSSVCATGYDEAGKKTCHWAFPILPGAGAIRSTGPDMLRFIKAAMGDGSEVSDAMVATQQEVAAIPGGAVGYGWHIDKVSGVMVGAGNVIWHNGGTGGFSSYMGFIKGKRRGVVVLSNQSNDRLDALAMRILLQSERVSLH